jgi:hypothetical protein
VWDPLVAKVEERDLSGFKLLTPVGNLLAALRDESNPNRQLHYDDYVVLLLFHFLNPVLTSLRGLQASTEFPRVRKKLGIPRSSLGSLSAAQHVFDPDLLADFLPKLLKDLPSDKGDSRLQALKQIVTIADGTLLNALPRVAWALWLNGGKRAAKAHVQFEVLKGGPSKLDVTAANASERATFKRALEPNRLYVTDSGFASFELFQDVIDVGSSFVCRLPSGWDYEVLEERELSDVDREARVIRDVVVRLGSSSSRAAKKLKGPVRIVEIEKVEEPSKRMRKERPVRETIVLVTDRLDLSAELIAVLYSARWKIEIFFRWLKCTLGCKDLLAESEAGAKLQVYAALISCLLISVWTGKKPTRRTYEAVSFYLMGLADEQDLIAHVRRLKPHA